MNSKINIVLFSFLLFYPLICFSQEVTQTDSSKENYNQALQFYIINQVIVAYKYNFSENSSVRFMINATGLFNNKDGDEIEYREQTTDTITNFLNRQIITSNQFFEFKVHYLYQTSLHEIIKLYFGVGPFVNYRFRQDEQSQETYYPYSDIRYNSSYKSNETIWNVGLSSLVGLECIVYKNINLFVEYEATLNYGWQNNDYYSSGNTSNSDNNKYDLWGYELKGIRLGIGIYF